MAAAALLRSVARKMSRAAAPTHHPSLVERGLHGSAGARSGPSTYSLLHGKLQRTADVLVSAGLRSGAGRLTTMLMAHAPHHRLVHGRGLHSSTSPASSALAVAMARAGDVAYYIIVFVAAIYVHIWYRDFLLCAMGLGDATKMGTGVFDKLGNKEKGAKQKMHSLENRVDELEATVMDLKAEIAELKIAPESGPSKGKV